MQERRFLLMTMLLVLLLGAPTVYSIVSDPSLLSAHGSYSQQRQIASVPVAAGDSDKEFTKRNEIKAKSITFSLECEGDLKAEEDHSVEGSLLRLKLEGCDKGLLKDVSITNVSNGFTASVIETKDQGFTTDFMDLKEGDNHVEIKGIAEGGEKVLRKLKFTRISSTNATVQ